jgi:hypothetical protein
MRYQYLSPYPRSNLVGGEFSRGINGASVPYGYPTSQPEQLPYTTRHAAQGRSCDAPVMPDSATMIAAVQPVGRGQPFRCAVCRERSRCSRYRPAMPDVPNLRPATRDELMLSLSFALRFNGRKRAHSADELMVQITAERLVEYLDRTGMWS